jgi:hydroxymethylpyrimidine/phosphomethylpyrimidine kinase
MLLQLEEAMAQLQGGGIAALIPEVQSNLGLALPHATTLAEVAAWEGRIVRVGDAIRPVGCPRFGASRHVATIILGAMRVDSGYRSAMNIRYGEDILQACRAANLRLAPSSRPNEPLGAPSREGGPLPGVIAEVRLGMESVPEIIYDLGAGGQEAMIWVLGRDAVEVSGKVLRIGRRVAGHEE